MKAFRYFMLGGGFFYLPLLQRVVPRLQTHLHTRLMVQKLL